jgi:hypothetical protein
MSSFVVASPSLAATPTFSATPTSGPIGTSIAVAAITKCPPPGGAGDWVAIVNVAQGADDQVSFKNFLIANDGSWSGTINLPNGLTLGAASLTASCFDAHHDVPDTVDYAAIPITVVAPTTTTSSTTTTAPSSTTSTTAAVTSTTAAAQAVTASPTFTG